MSFTGIKTWLFDLDNTLYSPASDIFPQIHERMSLYLIRRFGMTAEQASHKREEYFYTYGTTFRGLMEEHGIDPFEFMDFVHAVDLSDISPDPRLLKVLRKLPGQKIIFTNADRRHAERILNHLGLRDEFHSIFDIADGRYACKPDEGPYVNLLRHYGLNPAECCMVDDMERNLEPAARLGMKTLWLKHAADWLRHKPSEKHHYPHCHYVTEDLVSFMETIPVAA
jgi:putative hydrolase of the HAD superfamily